MCPLDFVFLQNAQGVYLKKNWQGGSAYFFGSEIFEILIFLGLEKSLLFFGV